MFSLSNLFNVIVNAAGKINTYAAGIENTVHTLEATDPAVKQLVDASLAEAGQHGIPVNAIENVVQASLSVAQAVSKAQAPTNVASYANTAATFAQAAASAVAQVAPNAASTANTVAKDVSEAATVVDLFTQTAQSGQQGPARNN